MKKTKKYINLSNISNLSNLNCLVSKQSILSDEQKKKYLVNLPFYNFIYAEEELGFSFTDFSKNNFSEFLQSCFINDLIRLRKFYILRNMTEVRFIAHKLKSLFRLKQYLYSLISSTKVKESCENLQDCIDNGKISVENEYINLLQSLNKFFQVLHELSIKLSKTKHYLDLNFNPELINKFSQLNDNCTFLEDSRIKHALSGNAHFDSNYHHDILRK